MLHKKKPYYVSNAALRDPIWVYGDAQIFPHKTSIAWLTVDEALSLKNQGYTVRHRDQNIEQDTEATPLDTLLKSGGGGSGTPLELEYTGQWNSNFAIRSSIPIPSIMLMPQAENLIFGPGAWIDDFYYSELELTADAYLTSVSLPNLVGTLNDFEIEYAGEFTTLSVPLLEYVGEYLELKNLAVTALNFPSLKYVNYEIEIGNCPNLTELNFPMLVAARDYFIVASCDALPGFNVANLVYTGEVVIEKCEAMTSVNFPELLVVSNYFTIRELPLVTTVSLPKLTQISYKLQITDCPILETIYAPALEIVRNSIEIDSPALVNLTFGSLIEVNGDVTITSPLLPDATILDLLETLAGMDGSGPTGFTYADNTITFGVTEIEAAAAFVSTLEGRSNTVVWAEE